jgi:hypothetical protein
LSPCFSPHNEASHHEKGEDDDNGDSKKIGFKDHKLLYPLVATIIGGLIALKGWHFWEQSCWVIHEGVRCGKRLTHASENEIAML